MNLEPELSHRGERERRDEHTLGLKVIVDLEAAPT
jgi:hypothetical protein